MSNCCLCGNKIGFGQKGAPLSNSSQDYLLCENCVQHKEILLGIRKMGGLHVKASSEYVSQKIQNNTNAVVVNEAEKWVEQASETVKKQIEIDTEQRIIQERIQSISAEDIENMLITSGFNFEGYSIMKYLGVFSGEYVLGTGFLSELAASFSDITGSSSGAFAYKLGLAKQQATYQLKKDCIAHGANAIIGIDFDYLTFTSNMIGVIANGTAVWIEKKH